MEEDAYLTLLNIDEEITNVRNKLYKNIDEKMKISEGNFERTINILDKNIELVTQIENNTKILNDINEFIINCKYKFYQYDNKFHLLFISKYILITVILSIFIKFIN